MPDYKKGQEWNKPKTKLMLQFEKEKEKSAVYRGKVTGQFEFWLWQREKKVRKKSKPTKPTKSKSYSPSKKRTPITKSVKIQDILNRINPYAVGVKIEEGDVIYFKQGKIGTPFKVTERKKKYDTIYIQLRNLKTGRLTERPYPEFHYLKVLKEIDKEGKDYEKSLKNPDADTWNKISQKRRFLFLVNQNYKLEAINKFKKMGYKELPIYIQRQLSFQVNGSNIDYVADMDNTIFERYYKKAVDVQNREKGNYYCLQCKQYHYEIRGKTYQNHIKHAKKGSKLPLLKVHIGRIQLKDLDPRLQKIIREYKRNIKHYVKLEIKKDETLPYNYKPAYIIKLHIRSSEREKWKYYKTKAWCWNPEVHKFMEY